MTLCRVAVLWALVGPTHVYLSPKFTSCYALQSSFSSSLYCACLSLLWFRALSVTGKDTDVMKALNIALVFSYGLVQLTLFSKGHRS